MNENALVLQLRAYMPGSDGWGHQLGRQVHERLHDVVESHSVARIIGISLAGVERTDASFPREAVIELALRYRKQRGFYLIDVDDADLLENWGAAAERREQPLFVWRDATWQLLGPQPGEGTRDMLRTVLASPGLTASEAATTLGITVQNASNKLKHLWNEGYVLRQERSALTGGVEYVYIPIK